jgi:hypothetical protein
MEKFMQDNAQQYKTLGSVGGAGSSATAGGYNQGNQISGIGGARGDSSSQHAGSPKAGGDVRTGGHFGPTTSAAPAGGYAQGDTFAATGGTSKLGSAPKGGLTSGGNAMVDGDGGTASAGQFTAGDQLVGKVK